jgi:predicted amidohydrolase
MRLALVQMNTTLGREDRNLTKHLEFIEQAKNENADLIIFPELSLTGYVLQDLVPTVAHHPTANDPIFAPLLKASQTIDMVVGFVEEDERNRFFIAAAYLSGGKVSHVHRKVYLPTYGLFDEGRFFAWGDQVRAFDTRFGRVGMLICEDFWHASPPYLLWLDGADLLIFISSSPGRGLTADPVLENVHWIRQINQAYASLFTSFVFYTNRVGYEDGLNFPGGAAVVDPNGIMLAEAPHHDEHMLITDIDLNQLHRTRARLPLLRDERTALVQRELNRILSDQTRDNVR